MKAFVTGGTGFIGSHLVGALLARGDEVSCLVRDPAKAERVFAKDHRPRTVRGTLDDVEALTDGCRNTDVVFHLAGLTAARSRAEFHAVNAHATRTLAQVAGRAAPNLQRFVYVSSLSAAGPSARGAPLTERFVNQPVSDYGWSKLAGEEAVRASGLPWTIVRPPLVYGPRDTEVLKLFKFAKLGVSVFFGDGSQELSFIYGPDLAESLIRTLSPSCVNKTFFASHEEIRTAREFSAEVYRVVKSGESRRGPVILAVPAPLARGILWLTGSVAMLARRATLLNADKANEFLAEAWTCSAAALTEATQWRPPTNLAAGLRTTRDWYAEARWL